MLLKKKQQQQEQKKKTKKTEGTSSAIFGVGTAANYCELKR